MIENNGLCSNNSHTFGKRKHPKSMNMGIMHLGNISDKDVVET